MAYDEVSFLNGILLGRSMKGVSMANPNRGDLLRVQSGHLAAMRRVSLRPDAAPGAVGGSAAVEFFTWNINGQLVALSASVPGLSGFGGVSAGAMLTETGERLHALASLADGLAAGLGAALRQKAADRSLLVSGMPEGLGGTLLAAGTITINE